MGNCTGVDICAGRGAGIVVVTGVGTGVVTGA